MSYSFVDDNSYSSGDLRVSDLDKPVEVDVEPDFDYENDVLHRHFVEKYQDLDSEIKKLKLDIQYLDHSTEDTILDLKQEYRELCMQINLCQQIKQKKERDLEDLKQKHEYEYKMEEETLRTQYNENLQNLRSTISSQKTRAYEIKQAIADTKLKSHEKMDKLNNAIVDLDEKLEYYRSEESKYTEKRGRLLSQQKQLKALLQSAIQENEQINENFKKVSKKSERINHEVKELEYTSAHF